MMEALFAWGLQNPAYWPLVRFSSSNSPDLAIPFCPRNGLQPFLSPHFRAWPTSWVGLLLSSLIFAAENSNLTKFSHRPSKFHDHENLYDFRLCHIGN
jgi:hypothetical protein